MLGRHCIHHTIYAVGSSIRCKLYVTGHWKLSSILQIATLTVNPSAYPTFLNQVFFLSFALF